MNKNKDITAIERIDESIADLRDKKFNIFFFVIDSRNTPNSSLAYIYELAKTLQSKRYNVTMLYQLQGEYTEAELHRKKKLNKQIDENKVFVGVGDWLGKEYADIPHMNIAHTEWKVSPSDILFIPEAFSSLMFQTYQHKAPCHRVVILQNFSYVTDFIPFGVEWKNYGIYDVLTTTRQQEELIKGVFPYVRTNVLPPMIHPLFRKPVKPKKLLVSIMANDQRLVNRIIKTFYWKYPIYKFVSFADLRNHSREEYAEKLKDSAISIWVDDDTPFGHSAIEAIKCDNILIGKVPEMIPEWMIKEDGTFSDCGLWTYDINDIPDLLANVVGAWMQDAIPSDVVEAMGEVQKMYTYDEWDKNVETMIDEYIKMRIECFNAVKGNIESDITENNKEEV